MAGYRRIKNAIAAENGEASIIIGQEGLKVPSADANLAAESSARRADGRNARLAPNKEGKLMAGQVTKLTGVPASKLRHYEGMGLLTPECTGKGVSKNRRLYGVQDLERLQSVLTLAEYGFGLSEIKQILDDESTDLYGAIARKLEELKRKEARLRALILFAKFVDMTDDTDLVEGLACGPANLDGFADLARTLPAYEQAMQRLDAYSEEEAGPHLSAWLQRSMRSCCLMKLRGSQALRRRWMRSSVGGASSLRLPKSLAIWDFGRSSRTTASLRNMSRPSVARVMPQRCRCSHSSLCWRVSCERIMRRSARSRNWPIAMLLQRSIWRTT